MKTLGSIVTPNRNKLGTLKVNEEMAIKFNSNSITKNVKRHIRVGESYETFKKFYEKVKISIDEEKQVIKIIDEFSVLPSTQTITTPVTTRPESMQGNDDVPESTVSRKTKVFQLIAENPDYLPRKRLSRKKYPTFNESDEDEGDEDDEDFTL